MAGNIPPGGGNWQNNPQWQQKMQPLKTAFQTDEQTDGGLNGLTLKSVMQQVHQQIQASGNKQPGQFKSIFSQDLVNDGMSQGQATNLVGLMPSRPAGQSPGGQQ